MAGKRTPKHRWDEIATIPYFDGMCEVFIPRVRTCPSVSRRCWQQAVGERDGFAVCKVHLTAEIHSFSPKAGEFRFGHLVQKKKRPEFDF